MSISPLNRSSVSAPAPSLAEIKPASTPAPSAASLPAQQPGNDLRRQLMTDSFQQGGGKLGGIEKAVEQLSQVLGELTQALKTMESQLGGQVPELGDGPQDLAGDAGGVGGVGGASGAAPAAPGAPAAPAGGEASAAPAAAGAAPSTSAAKSPSAPNYPTYDSDAGPGFGPPSAGSTEQVNPSEPWLAKNNVGTPYNSNMQLIDPGQKDQFKFTNTFTNKTNEPQTITLWNKTGENGNPNDGQNFDKSTPKTFTLQPGESQMVAFDNNSSVAWAASKDGTANPGANSGQTWGEATFGNAGTGWSGYDTSQIAPAGHNGKMSITNEATGKTVTEANAWQTPSDNPAGLDVGVPAGPMKLSTVLG